jgi:hypothetical protein
MGVLDKLKSRMNGPGKTPFGRPTEPVSEQVNNSLSLSKENIKRAKDTAKFVTKQGVKQGLKTVGQRALAGVFGLGGMLLSSQKAYGGGEFKSGSLSPEEQKKQFELIPEETSEEFQVRMANEKTR